MRSAVVFYKSITFRAVGSQCGFETFHKRSTLADKSNRLVHQQIFFS